ncbi:MAG TPA: hypothetical protein VGR57_04785 [Ktedonobacterales bacterium]|nr:hypothetical protein [Ktedonobacterales bacterium]
MVNALSYVGSGVTQFNGYSTNNPINPTVIQIGSEVYGTTGESESTAHQNNIQFRTNGTWNLVNPYTYNTNIEWPDDGTWTYPDSTNTGDWATACGC